MNRKEKLNHRKAVNRVRGNLSMIKKEPTFLDIYQVIFSHPDFTFLNVVNGYGFDEITYQEVHQQNLIYANYFNEKIIKEEYVGLMMENSPEWIYSFFGLLIAGFKPVLFNPQLSEAEVKDVERKLHLQTIVTNKDINLSGLKIINVFKIDLTNKVDFSIEKMANEIVLLTSGSTGAPKIVFYEGKQIYAQIENARAIFKNNKAFASTYHGYLKHLVVLPFYHVFGLFAVLLWFAFFNVTFVLPKSLRPEDLRQASLLTHPTHLFAVPLFYETLVTKIKSKCDTLKKQKKLRKALAFSSFMQKHFGKCGTSFVRNCLLKKYLNLIFGRSIRFCISGGAFVSEETLYTINALTYPLINGYGTTETGIIALNNSRKLKHRLSISIGRVFSSVKYEIKDGNLYVNSPSSSKRIIDSNGELITYRDDELVNTHDCVEEKNEKLFLRGRDDEIVIRQDGENISLPLIEKSLSLTIANEFALVYVNNKIVLIASYRKNVSLDKVLFELKEVRTKFPPQLIAIVCYTNVILPKANHIKIKRFELVQMYENNRNLFISLDDLENKKSSYNESIQSEIVDDIIACYKKVFADQEITPTTHYYTDLGGDSLHYFLLVNLIEEKFDVHFTITDLASAPYTPLDFAERIKE